MQAHLTTGGLGDVQLKTLGRWPAWLRSVGDTTGPLQANRGGLKRLAVNRTTQHCLRGQKPEGPGVYGPTPDTPNRSLAMELRPLGFILGGRPATPGTAISGRTVNHGARADAHQPAQAGTGTTHGAATRAPTPIAGGTTPRIPQDIGPCERDLLFENQPPPSCATRNPPPPVFDWRRQEKRWGIASISAQHWGRWIAAT